MKPIKANIAVSLDGFIATPDNELDAPKCESLTKEGIRSYKLPATGCEYLYQRDRKGECNLSYRYKGE